MNYKTLLLIILKRLFMYSFCILSIQMILCVSLLASGTSMGQNVQSIKEVEISISFKDKTIIGVFDQIESETGFAFVYLKNEIDKKLKLSGNYNNTSLYELLTSLSRETGLRFRRVNNNINVKKQVNKRHPVIIEVIQDITITGKVISGEDNEGLPGVNVIVKETSQGTVTDVEGNYSLEVSDQNAVLVFSSVGYVQEEIVVGTQTVIDVTLFPDIQALEEIVVTGYTAQSRRSITGAIETLDPVELAKNPGTSIEQRLQGQVAGVSVLTSGSPGSGAQVRIRGFGTTSSNSPLYIIDGAPSGSGLNEINPDDIESVSVMKDASAASIYGARAANGVVVITTKKGKKGEKARVSYNGFFSIDTDPGKIDVLNAEQWGAMEWQGQSAAGLSPSHPTYGNGPSPVIPEYLNGDPSLPYDENTNKLMKSADTDWFDELTQTGYTQNHNLSIAGGGDASAYNVSFGYYDRKGTQIHSGFQRYTTRINTEFNALNDKVRIGENLSIAYSERSGSTGSSDSRFRYHPLIPVYDEGGNFGGTLGGTLGLQTNARNPVAEQIRFKNNIGRQFRIFGNAYAEVDILPVLTFKTNLGIDYSQNNNTWFSPDFPEGGNPGNSLTESSGWGSSLTWNNTLNYSADFGDHTLGVLAGTEIIELKNRNMLIEGTNFFLEDPAFTYIDAAGTIARSRGNGSERKLSSLFGKVDYSYKGKYLVNYTIRRDGSSALPPGNRFDIFHAVGTAWVLSDEPFMAGINLINLLKIRAGWGQAGNQNSLGAFDYASTYTIDPRTNGYDINATNNGFVTGVALSNRGNNDLIWETSETLNIGLDFALLDSKISGSVEWYDRRTLGLLTRVRLPLTSGSANPPFINIGEIENKGIDLTLGYDETFGPLTLGITAIASGYRNKVIDIDGNPETFLRGPGGNPEVVAARTQAGQPIASFFGLIQDGVIQSGDDAGNFDFRDISGDENIDPNDDQTYIGNPHPDFTYSLNVVAAYKNFDFTMFFRGSQGSEIWQWHKIFTDFQFRSGVNRSTRVLDAWRPDNPTNKLAEYNQETAPDNLRASSYYIEDGSYLRLQTLQLGYTFPKIGIIQNLRLYLQGQNLFTITNYSGIDPEIPDNGELEKNVDRGNIYAVPRSFIVGLNVRF
ncbi:MAG: SusC/RagA family TonB-linked outer membrane protein [Cytophagales bacterium]|nr:SusC/RagA family TonB-linked outer membrane protein [Cytophagales bacterium]